MNYLKTVLVAIALFAAHTALAVVVPRAGVNDPRIGFVDYNPNDVVRITGYIGYVTLVKFEQGEELEPISILGFSKAWEIRKVDNDLTIKLVASPEQDAATNLIIRSNRRQYHFELVPGNRRGVAESPRERGLMFQVRFIYEKSDNRSGDQAAIPPADSKLNYRYSAQGETKQFPTRVWDNGTFTYLRFSNAQEIPAPFVFDENGESMTAFHMDGRVMVVHRVVKNLRLRTGQTVVCITREDPLMSGAK
jgi:type IV secretion system protein VirB9